LPFGDRAALGEPPSLLLGDGAGGEGADVPFGDAPFGDAAAFGDAALGTLAVSLPGRVCFKREPTAAAAAAEVDAAVEDVWAVCAVAALRAA
jgi:hypothetical protein